MGIIAWIAFGLLAGIIAKLLMPGRDPGGFIITTLLGVVGAFLGGYIATHLGYGTVTEFDVRSMAIAVGGALLLLIGYRLLVRR